MTAIPPVAAGGVPLFTPPQTPGHHVNGSTSSVPGMVAAGVKRESNASNASTESSAQAAANVAAGVKRGSTASEVGENGEGATGKKRRIAPTLVSGGGGGQNPSGTEGGGA